MINKEWQEYINWREDFLEDEIVKRTVKQRCQCDVEFGICPGVYNCSYSDCYDENGENND